MAEIIHGMHSNSVTTILAVFEVIKTLVAANMYGRCSTSFVHRFLNGIVTARPSKTKLCPEKYLYLYVAETMHGMRLGSVPT